MESDNRKTKAQLINELHVARQRLHELEKYSIVEKSNDGIAILQDGLVKFLNYKASEIYGFPTNVTLEKPFIDFIAPQSRAQVAEMYAKRLRGEEVPNTYEATIMTINGSKVPVEINASLIEYHGKPATLAIIRDITERKRAEKSVLESEEKFKTLAEKSPNMVFINKAGRIVYANQKCIETMGYSIEELHDAGFNFMNLVAPEFCEKTKANFITHAAGQDIPPAEYTFVTKNGQRIECILSTKLIDFDGSKAILGVVTDITEQKQIERKLHESEEKFRSLAEQSPNMVFINKSGTYIYVNRCFEEILGYSKEELYSPDFDFITLVAPESRELVKTTFKKHNVDNEDIPPFDLSLITRDGKRIEAILATKLIDYADGKSVVGVITDITERKNAEETLKLQAELLDAESDEIFLHDLEGNLLYVNKAACLSHGYTREEMLSMTLKQLDDPADVPLIGNRTQETLKNGQAVFEVNHIHKNGTLIPLEVCTSLIKSHGKTMILGAAHDISERRKSQQQLMAQDRLASIGQLVSGIAHELNNPLTSVIGFSELLLQKQLPEEIRDDLKIISDEARRTSIIVKNLLTFARQQPEKKCEVNINDPLQSVLQLRSHEQSVNNIRVLTDFAENLPFIMGNDSQLQQVFFNIVTNAEFAMLDAHHKGTLTISTRQNSHFVKTMITDDGPGVSDNNMKHLFSPFFTTKQPGKGTGLGLSICQGIISEHGGKIWAESEPGKGATFFVELPISNS